MENTKISPQINHVSIYSSNKDELKLCRKDKKFLKNTLQESVNYLGTQKIVKSRIVEIRKHFNINTEDTIQLDVQVTLDKIEVRHITIDENGEKQISKARKYSLVDKDVSQHCIDEAKKAWARCQAHPKTHTQSNSKAPIQSISIQAERPHPQNKKRPQPKKPEPKKTQTSPEDPLLPPSELLDKIKFLEKTLTRKEKDLKRATQKIKHLIQEKRALIIKLNQAYASNNAKTQEIKELKSQFTYTKFLLQKAKKEIHSLNHEVSNLKNAHAQTLYHLRELKDNMSQAHDQQIKEKNATIADQNQELHFNNIQIRKLNLTIFKFKEELKNVINRIEDLNYENIDEKNSHLLQLTNLRVRIENLQNANNDLNKVLETEKKEYNDLIAATAEEAADYCDKIGKLTAGQEYKDEQFAQHLQLLITALNSLKNKLNEEQKEQSDALLVIEEMMNETYALKSEKCALEKKLKDERSKFVDLNQRLTNLMINQSLSKNAQIIVESSSSTDSKIKQLTERLKLQENSHKQAIETLNLELKLKQEEIERLRILEMPNKLNSTEDVESMQQIFDQNLATIQQQYQEIDVEQEKHINKLDSLIKEKDMQIQILESELEGTQTRFHSLEYGRVYLEKITREKDMALSIAMMEDLKKQITSKQSDISLLENENTYLKENFTRLNQQIQQLEKDLKSMSQLPLTVKMSDFDPKKTSAENWASMQPTNINPIITDIFPITKLKSLSIRNLNKYSSEEILLEFSPERIIKIFTTLNTHFPEIVNHVRKTIKSHENNNYIATDDAINEFDFFEIINLDKKGIEERINADLIKLIIIKLNNKFLFINEIINQENELEALKINEEKEFNHLNLNRLNEISRLNSDFNSLKRTFNLFYNKYQNNLYPFEMKPTNEDFSNGSKQAQSLPMGKEAEEIMNRYDEYEKNKTLPLFNPLLKTEHVN